ncbi:hypothetical protein GW17_00038867 [Ensete ventricosum]|nr:hypothetical protein GW17_00038867 [Ensete ventricosum]
MRPCLSIPSNNEERAIVLYKPVEAPLILSSDSTNVSLQISSDLIHGLTSNSGSKFHITGIHSDNIFKPGNPCFDEKDEKTLILAV